MEPEYHNRDLITFSNALARVEKLPLIERRENRDELLSDLVADPHIIAERAQWLLRGHYGYGPQAAFNRLSPRSNRRAWLFNTVAAIEWHVPNKYARDVWNELDRITQAKINESLDYEIDHANAED